MALDLSFTSENRLIVYKETNTKQQYIKFEEGEVFNIFYFMVKHRTEMFLQIKDETVKARILETLLSMAKSEIPPNGE